MKKLLKNRPLVIALSVLILIFCGLLIAWQSALYTLNHMSFKDVTATQMASAMRQDEFWSSYRFNTLVFDGKVQSIGTNNNKTTLGLETSDSYGASCELTNPSTKFKVGQTYKFEAETYQAQRMPRGVLLHNCINL
ncbi:MAG: hypothetical protein ACREGG_00925 [Candidatus Saccharimonadales bacterium]